MENLVELKRKELQEIEGGGWLADIIAEVTYHMICDCVDWGGLPPNDGFPVAGKIE